MSISPIGIVFFIVTVIILMGQRPLVNMLVFSTITDIFFEAGYFMKTGDANYIYFFDYTQKFFLMYCLFYYISNNRFQIPWSYICLNICFIIPIVLLFFFPSDALVADGVNGIWDDIINGDIQAENPSITANVSRYTLRFIFAAYIALTIYMNFEKDDYKEYLFKLFDAINVFLIIGIIEFVSKAFLGLGEVWGASMESLLGYTDSTYIYENRERGSGFELALFTRESSHYVFSLLLCLIINLAVNIGKGKKNGIDVFTIICVLLILLSTSFSSILYLLSFIILYLLYRWMILCPPTMKKEMIFTITAGVLGSSLIMTILVSNSDGFITERLLNLFRNYDDLLNVDTEWDIVLDDFSSFARIYSVFMTIVAFLSRPVFGLSLGAAYCHGATAMLLSGIGIVGVFFFIRFFFFDVPYLKLFKVKRTSYIIAIVVYFLLNLLNSKELAPFCYSSIIAIAICFCVIFSHTQLIRE